jgi:hypothetical protein
MIKKEIVYPFFLECIQFAEDTFWENIFEDLLYGIAPYGTYISKHFLVCNYKNKEFSYKLEKGPSPKKTYTDIYTLLVEKLGLISEKEKTKKRMSFYKSDSENNNSKNEQWIDIKKKNIKDMLIEHYVIEMKKTHNLSLSTAKKLLSFIFFGLSFKSIAPKDIVFQNGKIMSIKDIDFINNELIINKKYTDFNLEDYQEEESNEKKTLRSLWKKYILNSNM